MHSISSRDAKFLQTRKTVTSHGLLDLRWKGVRNQSDVRQEPSTNFIPKDEGESEEADEWYVTGKVDDKEEDRYQGISDLLRGESTPEPTTVRATQDEFKRFADFVNMNAEASRKPEAETVTRTDEFNTRVAEPETETAQRTDEIKARVAEPETETVEQTDESKSEEDSDDAVQQRLGRIVTSAREQEKKIGSYRFQPTILREMRASEFANAVLPQLSSARCIDTRSETTLWLVYHDAESYDVATGFANQFHAVGDFMVRTLDNTIELPGAHERTSDILPSLGNYGGLLNENGAIIALGFGLQACNRANATRPERPRWVGTASWKAVGDTLDHHPDTCRTLPQIVQNTWKSPWLSSFAAGPPKPKPQQPSRNCTSATHGTNCTNATDAKNSTRNNVTWRDPNQVALSELRNMSHTTNTVELELEEISEISPSSGTGTNYATNETAFYWFDAVAQPDLVQHFANHPEQFSKQKTMLTRFFREVFDVDATYLFRLTVSEFGLYTPWKNWFITTPEIMLTLAKLHTILYSWIDTRYPLKKVGCSPEYFHMVGRNFWTAMSGEANRCWGYIGEYVTMVYLTSDTELLQLGCNKFEPFHKSHGRNFTRSIDVVWEAFFPEYDAASPGDKFLGA